MPLDPISATQFGAAAGSGGLAALIISLFNRWLEGRKYEKLDDKVDTMSERVVRLETEVISMDARQTDMAGILKDIQVDQKETLRHVIELSSRLRGLENG